MAVFKVYKFNELFEVEHFLAGGLLGSQVQYGVPSLTGTTITFTTPAFSATFVAGADPYITRFLEIKSQLETASGGLLKVIQFGGKIGFIEATPTTGCVLAASAAGSYGSLTGTVDLSGLMYGGGGTVDTKTFKVNVDGAGVKTVTFAAPADAAGIVSQINATVGLSGVARLSSTNHLILTSGTTGTGSSVALTNGSANGNLGFVDNQSNTGVAVNSANQLLGFDAELSSIGKVYLCPLSSTAGPYLYQVYSVGPTMHVLYTYEV